jgi:hypothetical protein
LGFSFGFMACILFIAKCLLCSSAILCLGKMMRYFMQAGNKETIECNCTTWL